MELDESGDVGAALKFAAFVQSLYEADTWGEWWDYNQRGGDILLIWQNAPVRALMSTAGKGQHCVVMQLQTAAYTVALKMVSTQCPLQELEFVVSEINVEGRILAEIERVFIHEDCKQHIGLLFSSGIVAPHQMPLLVLESYATYKELNLLFVNAFNFATDALWLEAMRQALFQIVFTLAQLQELFPGFRHNDLKDDNVLVNMLTGEERRPSTYTFRPTHGAPCRFILPVTLLDVKIIDFATAHADAPGMSNPHVLSNVYMDFDISKEPCPLYDLHFLFECFFLRLHGVQPTPGMQEVVSLFKDVVPEKYFTSVFMNQGRRLSLAGQRALTDDPDVRFKTPAAALRHPFFASFLVVESVEPLPVSEQQDCAWDEEMLLAAEYELELELAAEVGL